MDPQIEELKQLVRQSITLSQDNNQMLHKMRSASRWGFVFRIVWWLTIVGVTGAIYYYFLGPYVEQILQIFQKAQDTLNTFQSMGPGH